MKALQTLGLAYSLSRRYGFDLQIRLFPCDSGAYSRGCDVDGIPRYRPFVRFCPFDKHAIPILLHEVGHHVDHLRQRSQIEIIKLDDSYHNLCGDKRLIKANRLVISLLHEEANASQFAMRAIKALQLDEPGAKKYLWKCFTSYTNAMYKHFNDHEDRMLLTNITNMCCMKILSRNNCT